MATLRRKVWRAACKRSPARPILNQSGCGSARPRLPHGAVGATLLYRAPQRSSIPRGPNYAAKTTSSERARPRTADREAIERKRFRLVTQAISDVYTSNLSPTNKKTPLPPWQRRFLLPDFLAVERVKLASVARLAHFVCQLLLLPTVATVWDAGECPVRRI